MNVLLTGNGFDLAHKLPTKYIDFINVAEELNHLDIDKCKRIAYILGIKSNLYNTNEWIKECCDTHDGFGGIELNPDKMKELLEGSKNNLWIQYFIKYKDGNIGWIDFEKEMQEALEIIENIINIINNDINLNMNGIVDLRADHFCKASFFEKIFETSFVGGICINLIYLKRAENGSYYNVDYEKISAYLTEQLNELISLLNIYLEEIINKISSNCKQRNIYKKIQNIDFQINFNYTNTAEYLYDYQNLEVCYCHGKAIHNGENMVLGTREYKEINNDFFYNFRKYYQCIQKSSDFSYRKLLQPNSKNSYYVWGHSLDETDGDILRDIFTNSNTDIFKIFFHSIEARNQQVKNLIALLGKELFQNYFYSKKLEFEEIK